MLIYVLIHLRWSSSNVPLALRSDLYNKYNGYKNIPGIISIEVLPPFPHPTKVSKKLLSNAPRVFLNFLSFFFVRLWKTKEEAT